MEKIGRSPETLSIVAMLMIVPLVYTTNIYDYTLVPKRLAFFACLALAAFGWLAQAIRSRSTISYGLPTQLLGTYAILVCLSLYKATNLSVGIVELIFQLALICLYLLAAQAKPRDVQIWMWTILGISAVVSTIGIQEYLGVAFADIPSNGRPSATFGFRNFAAMYLVASLPVCFYQFWLGKGTVSTAVSAVSGVLTTLFLLYTRTRGAWLGAAAGLIGGVVLVVAEKSSREAMFALLRSPGTFRSAAACVSLLLILAAGSLSPGFRDTGLQRFDDKKSDLTTTVTSALSSSGDRGRLLMWRRTIPLIWDNLFTGVGPGHWEFVYPNYDQGAMVRADSSPKRPHNDYIWIAAEHGIIALGVFLAFLASVILAGFRRAGKNPDERHHVVVAVSVIVGVSVHAFFSFPKEQPQVVAVFFLMAGIATRSARGRSGSAIPVAALALLISTVGSVAAWRQMTFDTHYLSALIAEDRGDWHAMNAAAARGLGRGEFRPHLRVISGRAHEKLGDLDSAEAAYKRSLVIAPYSWHAHNGLGIISKRRGSYEEAMVFYERALELSPRAHSVRVNLGSLYRAMGNESRAEAQFRRVLGADSTDEGANNNLANVMKARGETDSAEVYYRKALESDPDFPQANQNLGDIMMGAKKYRQAIQHYQAAMKTYPDRVSLNWGLASALEASGRLEDAEIGYLRAIEIDPNFPRSYFSLATMLYGLHRWDETIEYFETFKGIWKGDPKFIDFANSRIRTSKGWLKRMDKK